MRQYSAGSTLGRSLVAMFLLSGVGNVVLTRADLSTRPHYAVVEKKAKCPIGAVRYWGHDPGGVDDIGCLTIGGSVVSTAPGDVNWTMAIIDVYTQ